MFPSSATCFIILLIGTISPWVLLGRPPSSFWAWIKAIDKSLWRQQDAEMKHVAQNNKQQHKKIAWCIFLGLERKTHVRHSGSHQKRWRFSAHEPTLKPPLASEALLGFDSFFLIIVVAPARAPLSPRHLLAGGGGGWDLGPDLLFMSCLFFLSWVFELFCSLDFIYFFWMVLYKSSLLLLLSTHFFPRY